jgi:prevent-host-death family protein
MPTTTLTSREANQNFSRAKRAAKNGPVIITEHGKPAQVLMSYEEYRRLKGPQRSILDLLAMPGMEDIEFEVGERPKDPPREVEFD